MRRNVARSSHIRESAITLYPGTALMQRRFLSVVAVTAIKKSPMAAQERTVTGKVTSE